jgi:hypothetical protein
VRWKRFVTPLTIGFGAVVFLSGLLMFVGVKTASIHAVHEYIGALFVIIVALHLIVHKNASLGYFQKTHSIVVIAASVAICAVFLAAIPEKRGGGNAWKALAERAIDAPIAETAQLFDLTEETLRDRLAEGGISISNAEESLGAIARKHNLSPDAVIEKMMR